MAILDPPALANEYTEVELEEHQSKLLGFNLNLYIYIYISSWFNIILIFFRMEHKIDTCSCQCLSMETWKGMYVFF
jgi:hypothetical protein